MKKYSLFWTPNPSILEYRTHTGSWRQIYNFKDVPPELSTKFYFPIIHSSNRIYYRIREEK